MWGRGTVNFFPMWVIFCSSIDPTPLLHELCNDSSFLVCPDLFAGSLFCFSGQFVHPLHAVLMTVTLSGKSPFHHVLYHQGCLGRFLTLRKQNSRRSFHGNTVFTYWLLEMICPCLLCLLVSEKLSRPSSIWVTQAQLIVMAKMSSRAYPAAASRRLWNLVTWRGRDKERKSSLIG